MLLIYLDTAGPKVDLILRPLSLSSHCQCKFIKAKQITHKSAKHCQTLAWFVAQHFRRCLICWSTYQAWSDMLGNILSLAWYVGQHIKRGLICCATNQAQHIRPGLMFCNESTLAWLVAPRIRSCLKCCATNQAKLSQVVVGGRKINFLGGFSLFFALYRACMPYSCMWNANFTKEIGPIDLF